MCRCNEPRFMKETRVEVFRSMTVESVRLIHLPTGLVAKAGTRENAIQDLGLQLSELHPCDLSRSGPFAPIKPEPIPVGGRGC